MKTEFTNDETGTFLINHLDRVTEVNKTGEVAFKSSTQFDTAIDVLTENINFARTVVHVQRRAIVRQAFIEAKKAGDV